MKRRNEYHVTSNMDHVYVISTRTRCGFKMSACVVVTHYEHTYQRRYVSNLIRTARRTLFGMRREHDQQCESVPQPKAAPQHAAVTLH